jgi:hypothetical protein
MNVKFYNHQVGTGGTEPKLKRNFAQKSSHTGQGNRRTAFSSKQSVELTDTSGLSLRSMYCIEGIKVVGNANTGPWNCIPSQHDVIVMKVDKESDSSNRE